MKYQLKLSNMLNNLITQIKYYQISKSEQTNNYQSKLQIFE